jgi:hypothetical protein
MLVEMVWRMMRWQPDYRPLKKWAHVLYSPTPNAASRKKAVVAIARQLAVDLWRIFTGAAKAETFGLIYLPEFPPNVACLEISLGVLKTSDCSASLAIRFGLCAVTI